MDQIPTTIEDDENRNKRKQEGNYCEKITKNIAGYINLCEQTMQFKPEIFLYLMAKGSFVTPHSKLKVEVKIDEHTSTVTASSERRTYISSYFKRLSGLIERSETLTKPKSNVFLLCLKSIKPTSIKGSLAANKLQAGWNVEENHLLVCSAPRSVRKSLNVIECLVREFQFPDLRALSPLQIELLNSYNWPHFLGNIKEKYQGLQLEYVAILSKVCVAMPSEIAKEEIVVKLQTFFVENNTLSDPYAMSLPLPKIHLTLIKNNISLFQQCVPKYENENVSFSMNLDEKCCILKSNSQDLIDMIEQNMKNLLSKKLSYRKINPVQLNYVNWFKSTSCARIMNDVDTLCGTVSSLESDLLLDDYLENPLFSGTAHTSLGWLFEHLPFLYQYRDLNNTLSDPYAMSLPLPKIHLTLIKNNISLFQQCVPKYENENVSFSMNLDEKCCILKSNSQDLIDMIEQNMKNLLSKKLSYRKINPVQLNYVNWFKSTSCARIMNDVDTLCGTVSSLESDLLLDDYLENPLFSGTAHTSLGWLFEHLPFLYQYRDAFRKITLHRGSVEDMPVSSH